jgi:hypothetical protein
MLDIQIPGTTTKPKVAITESGTGCLVYLLALPATALLWILV